MGADVLSRCYSEGKMRNDAGGVERQIAMLEEWWHDGIVDMSQ